MGRKTGLDEVKLSLADGPVERAVVPKITDGLAQGRGIFPILPMVGFRKPKSEKGAQIQKGRIVLGTTGEVSSGGKGDLLTGENSNQARWERAKLLSEGKHGGDGMGCPKSRVQLQVELFNSEQAAGIMIMESGSTTGGAKGGSSDRKRSRSPMRIKGGTARDLKRGLDHVGDSSD